MVPVYELPGFRIKKSQSLGDLGLGGNGQRDSQVCVFYYYP